MLKRILKIFFATIILIAIVSYFSYDYWLERELKYKLSEIINTDPNNLYQYSFKNLNIHLLEGSVDITGVSIAPKQYAYDSLAIASNGIRYLVELNLSKIELENFQIKEFLLTGIMRIKALIISKPRFNYFFHPQKKDERKSLALSNIFSDKFKEANIEQFLIKNAEVKILDFTKAGPAVTIRDLNIELTEAHIDSATLKQFTPIQYKDILAKAAGINIASSDDFEINSDTINFKVRKQTIEINNFQINPRFSQKAFANKYKVQKQWFAIQLDKLIISQINFPKFVHSGDVEIGRIDIVSPNIGLYKDKSKPIPPFKKKLLPASAIKTIPWNISVDSVRVVNGIITINETSAVTGDDSHLTINKLNALLLHFTNDSLHRAEANSLLLRASALVMNKADTQIEMQFDLNSSIDKFSARGNVGSVDAVAFNPVLEPLMGVKVIDGKIHNLNFSFTAMDTLSTGKLDIEYENIKLELMNVKNPSKKQNKKGFLSLAANTVVKTHNLKTQGKYLQGVINTRRVLEKDVWPYLWHSIQSGLVSTLVPVTNNKEAKQQQKEVRKKLKNKKKNR